MSAPAGRLRAVAPCSPEGTPRGISLSSGPAGLPGRTSPRSPFPSTSLLQTRILTASWSSASDPPASSRGRAPSITASRPSPCASSAARTPRTGPPSSCVQRFSTKWGAAQAAVRVTECPTSTPDHTCCVDALPAPCDAGSRDNSGPPLPRGQCQCYHLHLHRRHRGSGRHRAFASEFAGVLSRYSPRARARRPRGAERDTPWTGRHAGCARLLTACGESSRSGENPPCGRPCLWRPHRRVHRRPGP
mmetsp:Transcript_9649/g.28233  ORF Transcript_9649/g.28233 Transcript_9649/m.28233 type:complete len:247 (-) Transcript_9649:616-1356(-)